MALTESLLTAIVRADGDALVMHVGEKPYVVASAGPIELSTQGLNLQAMAGMVAQLLPAELQRALTEFGAVEHELPTMPVMHGDRFTVVVARGGDDVWIEIRRHRRSRAVAAADDPLLVGVSEADGAADPMTRASSGDVVSDALLAAEPLVAARPFDDTAVEDYPAAAEEFQPAAADETSAARSVMEPAASAELGAVAEHAVTEPLSAAPAVAAVADSEPASLEPAADADSEPQMVKVAETMAAPEPGREPEPLSEPEPAETVVTAATELTSESAIGQRSPEAAEPTTAPEPVAEMHVAISVPPAPDATVGTPSSTASVIPMTRTLRIEVPRVAPPRQPFARSEVERLLGLAAARGATALYLTTQASPFLRVDDDVQALEGEPPLTATQVEAAVLELMPETTREALRRGVPTEWVSDLAEIGRVRCSTFRDYRGPGAIFQLSSFRPVKAEQLGLSPEIQALASETEGLVLVASPLGHGKSTLIGAFVDLINHQRSGYVITLERQIRLVHEHEQALISQREVRGTADQVLNVARAAWSENADVLVIDDLPSAEVLQLALDAAGSGRFVIASVTAPSVTAALTRIVELFPADQRKEIQSLLAERLRGAVGQVLLRKTAGGRVAAREVVLATSAVVRVLAEGQLQDLPQAIESGRKYGLVSLTDSLVQLVRSGAIDAREAYRKADDRQALLDALKRENVDTTLVERLA